MLWIPVVLFAHKLMCKFVFLENDTGGKFLSITNRWGLTHWTPNIRRTGSILCSTPCRNGFNCFSYFVFLYNGIVGFVAAILRVLLGLLFGTLLLFRLDQNIMMDHFKFADLGPNWYLQLYPLSMHFSNWNCVDGCVLILFYPYLDCHLKPPLNEHCRGVPF